MKKTLIVILTSVGLVAVILFGMCFMFTSIASPQSAVIQSVDVSEGGVQIQGSFTGSSMWYKKYKSEQVGSELFVSVISTSLSFLGKSGDPFTVQIPDAPENLTKIYLRGASDADTKLVWEK